MNNKKLRILDIGNEFQEALDTKNSLENKQQTIGDDNEKINKPFKKNKYITALCICIYEFIVS